MPTSIYYQLPHITLVFSMYYHLFVWYSSTVEPYQPEPYHSGYNPPTSSSGYWQGGEGAPSNSPQESQDAKDPTLIIEMGGPVSQRKVIQTEEGGGKWLITLYVYYEQVTDNCSLSSAEADTAAPSNRTVIANKRPMPPNQGPYHGRPYHRDGGPPFKRRAFNYDRLGPKRPPDNATLEVQKIPPEMNTISKLNEHFSKFGDITNLQVCFRGDPQAAAITFSTNAQANSAYRSTEPIFNNRFIKVFWHKKEDQENQQQESKVQEVKVIPPPHKMQLNNTARNAAAVAKAPVSGLR